MIKDFLGFSLIAIMALGAGARSQCHRPQAARSHFMLRLAEKLAAEVGSGATSIGFVAINTVQEMVACPDVVTLDARPRDFYELGYILGAKISPRRGSPSPTTSVS